MTRTVIARLASLVTARQNCAEHSGFAGTDDWFTRHTDAIRAIEREHLPSGSGIDNGTTVDLDRSTADRVILNTAFHHMNDGGYYDGWTEHTVTVRPTFDGIIVKVSGRDRNLIKDYLADTFRYALLVQTDI